MPKRSADEAFEALLEGTETPATPELEQLAAFARALSPAEHPGPAPAFRAQLREALVVRASETEEDVFAAVLEGRYRDPAVTPLVKIAAALEVSARRAEPSPQFRYRLRNQLIAEAARPSTAAGRIAAMAQKTNERWRRSLRRVAATGMAASMMLGGGTALAASQDALPGDPITYRVKLIREDLQLWPVSGSTEGLRLLGFARTRVTELRGLTERREVRIPLYTSTLDRMDTQTLNGQTLVLKSGSRDAIRTVVRFAQAQAQDLGSLMPLLPPGARPAARDSLDLAEGVAKHAQDRLDGCPCASIDNPLVPNPSIGDGQACPCADAGGSTQTGAPGGSSNTGSTGGTTDQTGNGGSTNPGTGGETSTDDPSVDVPDVPGTPGLDNQVEDVLDGLIDGVAPSPEATPTLPPITVPSLLPSTPTVPVPSPSLGL